MRRPTLILSLLVCLTISKATAGDPQCEVNVNIAMTEDGQKVTLPTKENPTYYFPLVAGYRERGARVANEQPPPAKPIVHLLAKALADQHYLVVNAKHHDPAILLVLFWGYMNPQIDEVGSLEDPQKVFWNQKEMLALLGGQTWNMLDLDFEKEAVMQGAEDNRYFVIVSAYDFAAARRHKKVLLWQARMSTPSYGVTLEEAIPPLIAAGGPLFGRETVRPKWVTLPAGRQGFVEVGEPEFKNYVDTPMQPPVPTTPTPPTTKK